jgi:hypothetical protein
MADEIDALRDKITAEILPCDWAALRPHHQRQALFLVSPDLDLVEAALAVAANRADRVEAWLTVGRLGRPQASMADVLKAGRFQFVIVQPFVLAQLLPSSGVEA